MKIRYVMALMAAVATAVSCARKDDAPEPVPDREINLNFNITRALPDLNTTYGFIIYNDGTQTDGTPTYKDPVNNLYGTGTYRYAADYHNSQLVPCATDATGAPKADKLTAPVDTTGRYDPTKGVCIPQNGGATKYRCYMYTPGIPASNYGGSTRVRYTLAYPLTVCISKGSTSFATKPDDGYFTFNVAPSAYPTSSTDAYRAITVPVDQFDLITLVSKIDCEFQQHTSSFTVSAGQVLFIGDTACYHLALKTSDILNQSETTASPLVFIPNPSPAPTNPILYLTSTPVSVFPADYSLTSLKNLDIRFNIQLAGMSTAMTKDIPIAFRMDASFIYHFHIDVYTKVFTVTYTASPLWDDRNLPADQVGSAGLVKTLGTFPLFDTTDNQWDTSGGNDGSTTIGG